MQEGRVHPQAWLEMFESHTPYEWRLQQARAIVDPWGDDRADARAQVNTAQLMASQTEDESMRARVAELVADYYQKERGDPRDLELNEEALAALPKVPD